MIIVGVAVACVAGWVVAPFVGMRRRGTLDEQCRGAIREEARHVAATPLPPPPPSAPPPPPPPAVSVLPTPRGAPDETSPSPAPRATSA